MREMNKKVLSKYTNCTVGEMPCGVDEYESSKYVAKERQELSLVFQFDHMELDSTDGDKWTPRKWELWEFEKVFRVWQQHMLGNNGNILNLAIVHEVLFWLIAYRMELSLLREP